MIKDRIETIKTFLEGLEENGGVSFTEEEERNISKVLFEAVKKHLQPRKREGVGVLSPSSLGRCTRQLAYKYNGFKGEPLTYANKLLFMYGDLIEAIIYVVADKAGVPFDGIQDKIEVGDTKGNIDGIWEDVLVDIKSMSPASFSISKRGGVSDGFGYQTQMEYYKKGKGLDKGGWLGVNKVSGEMHWFDAPSKSYLVDVGESKREIVLNSTPENLPKRDYQSEIDPKSKRNRLCFQCKFCEFKQECWDILEVGKGYNKSEVYYV